MRGKDKDWEAPMKNAMGISVSNTAANVECTTEPLQLDTRKPAGESENRDSNVGGITIAKSPNNGDIEQPFGPNTGRDRLPIAAKVTFISKSYRRTDNLRRAVFLIRQRGLWSGNFDENNADVIQIGAIRNGYRNYMVVFRFKQNYLDELPTR